MYFFIKTKVPSFTASPRHAIFYLKNTIDAHTELVYIKSYIWNITVNDSIRMKSPFMFVTIIKIVIVKID